MKKRKITPPLILLCLALWLCGSVANTSMTQNIIEMRGVTKRFGAVVANKGVDLSIPANTIHAIVGENGAGKSTIMKILYGFYTADEGEIWIDGERREIKAGEVILVEDTTGKGHLSKAVDATIRHCIFVPVE